MASHVGSGHHTRYYVEGQAQHAAALAYLADQETAILVDLLATTTDPVQAIVLHKTLNQVCDGSGFRMHSGDGSLIGPCWKCEGAGCGNSHHQDWTAFNDCARVVS